MCVLNAKKDNIECVDNLRKRNVSHILSCVSC